MNDMQAGKAGEFLVCADLILQGYSVSTATEGLHYDILVDDGGKFYRVQVKTTRTHRATPQRKNYTPSYLFHARRCGKGGRYSYSNLDIDVMAFVALDSKLIAYLPIEFVKQTIYFRTKQFEYIGTRSGIYMEDYKEFKNAIT